MEAIEVIKKGTYENGVLILPPGQLERKLYQDVAKKLEGIGGKWNRGKNGFVFSTSQAEDLLQELRTGVVRNLKKESQFFATPQDIAEGMANELYLKDSDTVLEPSAGQGALIDAVLNNHRFQHLFYCEQNIDNQLVLHKKYDARQDVFELQVDARDFLKLSKATQYDKIIANPPFSKNQDIDHIMWMYELLKKGGRMVTCASKHWQIADNSRERAFKKWIDDTVEASIYDLESGRFKTSGTMVASCILVIDK